VKGEFANIGVVLRELPPATAAVGAPQARVRFTRDWTRVRCLDADADLGLLEALESEIEARLKLGAADPKPVLAQMEESFSNSVQLTEARACLAETLPAELDLLMQMYVESRRAKHAPARTGRATLARQMRTNFERAGVWALMRKRIAASVYTRPGDPLRIDCGYRPNGVVKMFHAVSLAGDVEAAKVLAFSAPRLREGIARVEKAKLELTAVVEPLGSIAAVDREDESGGDVKGLSTGDLTEAAERYRYGVETLEEQAIRVITANDLARAAAIARTDLRL
jgi:hypothetical protein